MIVVESKRKNFETLAKKYPGAVILDVTSNSTDSEFVKFSPFYPHYDIPVPGSPTLTGACVEGIWQGLKIFEGEGVSYDTLRNGTMKNIKRTVRTHGKCLGHKYGNKTLGYIEARKLIYVPAYNWVLQNRLGMLVSKLRDLSSRGTVVLLDYETNGDVENASKPLSHASLIKAYIEAQPEKPQAPTAEYEKGIKVRHAKFGEGEVISYSPETRRIVVTFAEGEKTLSTRIAKLEIVK